MFVALVDLQPLQGKDPERGIPRWIHQFTIHLRDQGVRVVGLVNPNLPPIDAGISHCFNAVGPNSRGFVRSQVAEESAVYICSSPFEPIRPVRHLLPLHIVDSGIPVATVMYDLVLYLFPDFYQVRDGDRQTYQARKTLFETSDAFLCISESTQQDVCRAWNVDPKQVHHIGTGVDQAFEPTSLSDEFRRKHGIASRFVFCVGRDDPRKQTPLLIEAFGQLDASLRDGLQLVVTCRLAGDTETRWRRIARDAGLKDDDLVLTGIVTDEELRGLYTECELFVEPSLYEGFGFPAAEAAACGAVVITSNSSSLPEILDFPPSMFDASSSTSITKAMIQALTDSEFRSSNRAAGSKVRVRHSWDLVAKRSCTILSKLARPVVVPRLTIEDFFGDDSSTGRPPVDSLNRTFPASDFDGFDETPQRLRIGVYDRFWATMGGGEQHAGAAAVALSGEFDVELIGVEDFDRSRFARILGQPRAAELPLRVIDGGPTAATEVSADYDIFINHSFTSEDVNLAGLGLYVTFFPQEYRLSDHDDPSIPQLNPGEGSNSEPDVIDSLQVSVGGMFSITSPSNATITMILESAGGRLKACGSSAPDTVEHFGAGRSFFRLKVGAGSTRIQLESASDVRVLSPRTEDGRRVPIIGGVKAGRPAFASTYDRILGNSMYTSQWIRRRWNVNAPAHYPPVALRQPSAIKENVILSIGRFFGEASGHCKQQLQMVRAFRQMLDDGLTGWKLVLVGGADKAYRDYALAVRREAAGLPIDVLLNADFDTLNEELARASIYWHATGLGADLERVPERAEHFGIAPVEAMSTGAIPVLFGAGGLAEIVRDGIDGFLFSTLDDLVSKTRAIIESPESERLRLRQAAIERSQQFSSQRFATELLGHIHAIIGAKNVSL